MAGGGVKPGPDTVTLRVCTVCGRDDRHLSLNRHSPHYTNGARCSGRVVDVTYRRAS